MAGEILVNGKTIIPLETILLYYRFSSVILYLSKTFKPPEQDKSSFMYCIRYMPEYGFLQTYDSILIR